jgi:predicted PP-loop superfamily ATPase
MEKNTLITIEECVKIFNEMYIKMGLPSEADLTVEELCKYFQHEGWLDDNNELTEAGIATGKFFKCEPPLFFN